ncbi:AraC family transcriptional regulator [Pseudemcibacter aquimaris]|uniref:AraC family transcriptional regulator n=1 Tax=Pseudemcibacter aquimaris TaxID=2857064 RepID=UPI0020121585|nr:helix-turn-helix domain-containing protein [Pseudemcibacter aquimaris]MCC3862511.1 helix-turn-helix domain-containing protein [Pseudemcibacter aquimaris]WDU57773.1 helix-turn-helix domain-containing protein [Pseudemcibacter aquimaris]
MALQALFLDLSVSKGHESFSATLKPVMPLLFAPLSFLLFQCARKVHFKLSPIHILHALPAITVFTLMLTRYFINIIDIVILATLMGYAVALSFLTFNGKIQFHFNFKNNNNQNAIFTWLIIFTGYAWFSFASDVLIYIEISNGAGIVHSTSLFITIIFKLALVSFAFIFALQKSPYFDWLYETRESKQTHELPYDKKREYAFIINEFEAILKNPKIYTDEVFSLKAMADKIGVPARLFSNAINHKFSESYSKHMNHRRVCFAETLLKENPELNMTNIMFDAGFRTKSSFNKEFKAITGMTPTEYRNSL